MTPACEIRCKAKIRYRQPEQWVTVILTGEDAVRIFYLMNRSVPLLPVGQQCCIMVMLYLMAEQ